MLISRNLGTMSKTLVPQLKPQSAKSIALLLLFVLDVFVIISLTYVLLIGQPR